MLTLELRMKASLTAEASDGDVRVKLLEVRPGRRILLGVDAPPNVPVVRDDMTDEAKAEIRRRATKHRKESPSLSRCPECGRSMGGHEAPAVCPNVDCGCDGTQWSACAACVAENGGRCPVCDQVIGPAVT